MRFGPSNKDVKIEYAEVVCKETRRTANFENLDLNNCAYDATPPIAVYVRNTLNNNEQDNIKHAFSALSNRFGQYGDLVDVFELFGEFEPGQLNVLFSDNAKALITDDSVNFTESFFNFDGDDETTYKNIQCRD